MKKYFNQLGEQISGKEYRSAMKKLKWSKIKINIGWQPIGKRIDLETLK